MIFYRVLNYESSSSDYRWFSTSTPAIQYARNVKALYGLDAQVTRIELKTKAQFLEVLTNG